MLPDFYQFIVVFIFGLCIGSFLNVCIYRLPLDKSIVFPPSSCPKCGHKLRFYENIPVISYIFLKGRCSKCKETISVKYPIVEILTGILACLLWHRFGLSISFFIYAIFSFSLLVITFIDLEHKIIPDSISLPGIILGFVSSFLLPDLDWISSLAGILLGGGILYTIIWAYYLLFKKIAMGGGDIKLNAMIGAFLGWQAIPFVLFFSALTGAIVGILLLLFKNVGRYFQMPFGPFLSIAALFHLLFPEEAYRLFEKIFFLIS